MFNDTAITKMISVLLQGLRLALSEWKQWRS